MKIKFMFLSLAFFIQVAGLHAQSLDAATLDRVKEFIAQVRHPDQVDMYSAVRSIAPANTEGYIMAVADDPALPGATRMRSFGLLGNFSESAGMRAFLESRMENAGLNESYRQMALTSLVRAFHAVDPSGVETAVRRAQTTAPEALRLHAFGILENMRRGESRPAGETIHQRMRGSR